MEPPTSSLRSARLDKVATHTGHFAVLAIDHVGSFAATVRPDDPDSMATEDIWAQKLSLINGLGPAGGAMLVDPGFLEGTAFTRSGALSETGLILGIEDGDYVDVLTAPRFLPGWSVERAARLGVDAVKISMFFRPGGDTSAATSFVTEVVDQCRRQHMPLFAEPLALYDHPHERGEAVTEGVRLFGHLGADILKLQFPEPAENPCEESWAEACREINRLSPVPWAILSEGGDYQLFRRQLQVACRAGATGFLGGRAVWREAATGEGTLDAAAARLRELNSIAVTEGVDWKSRKRAGKAGCDRIPECE
ncbi:MAG: hypothetical protein F4Z41_08610 [Acidimicrobiia bacterium]|nr:hypothetical protein [Acidimicrobiia bacterium]